MRGSDKDGDKGPIRNDSADWPMRGTDLRLICGPDWEEDMLYRSEEDFYAGNGWMQWHSPRGLLLYKRWDSEITRLEISEYRKKYMNGEGE